MNKILDIDLKMTLIIFCLNWAHRKNKSWITNERRRGVKIFTSDIRDPIKTIANIIEFGFDSKKKFVSELSK